LEISITPTGSVDGVKILTGNATLTGAAASALKHWRFEPFTSDGKPFRAVAVISFSFKP
jgi:TonB family protein